MTLWSLQQDDDFYDEKRNQSTFGGGIWNMLVKELNLSEDQKKGLVDMRHQIRDQRKNIGECLRILADLESRVGENLGSMKGEFVIVFISKTNLYLSTLHFTTPYSLNFLIITPYSLYFLITNP